MENRQTLGTRFNSRYRRPIEDTEKRSLTSDGIRSLHSTSPPPTHRETVVRFAEIPSSGGEHQQRPSSNNKIDFLTKSYGRARIPTPTSLSTPNPESEEVAVPPPSDSASPLAGGFLRSSASSKSKRLSFSLAQRQSVQAISKEEFPPLPPPPIKANREDLRDWLNKAPVPQPTELTDHPSEQSPDHYLERIQERMHVVESSDERTSEWFIRSHLSRDTQFRFALGLDRSQEGRKRITPWSAKYNPSQSKDFEADPEDSSDSDDAFHSPCRLQFLGVGRSGTGEKGIPNQPELEEEGQVPSAGTEVDDIINNHHRKAESRDPNLIRTESPSRWKMSGRSSTAMSNFQSKSGTMPLLAVCHRNEEQLIRTTSNDHIFLEMTDDLDPSQSDSSPPAGRSSLLGHQDVPVREQGTTVLPSGDQTTKSKEDYTDYGEALSIGGITFDGLLDKICNSDARGRLSHITLLTYQSFTTSAQLVEAIINKFVIIEDNIGRLRLLNMIQRWMTQYHLDFFHEKEHLLPILEPFLQNLISDENFVKYKKLAEGLCIKLRDQKPSVLTKTAERLSSHVTLDRGTNNDIWSVEAEDIARQLTLIDEALFRDIPLWEYLNQSWAKSNRADKAPHICKMIARFNQVSLWVRCEIVTEVNPKRRTELLSKWLEVCEHLQKLNNFNALMQILAALNSLPIFRLKKTWNSLSKSKKTTWSQLETIFDTRVLRTLMQSARTPLVPFLGMYLTDLTLIEENADMIDDGQINFAKRTLIARTISQLLMYQQHTYQINMLSDIQDWLLCITPIDDDDILEACSVYIEPKKGMEQPEIPPALRDYLNSKPQKEKHKKKYNSSNRKTTKAPEQGKKLKKRNIRLSGGKRGESASSPSPSKGTTPTHTKDDYIFDEKIAKIQAAFMSHKESLGPLLERVSKLGTVPAPAATMEDTSPEIAFFKETAFNDLKALQEAVMMTLGELKTELVMVYGPPPPNYVAVPPDVEELDQSTESSFVT